VRVQGMRYEGHGWDPKGPASIHRARAALDKDGAVIGYAFESKGFSRVDIDTNESDPAYSLAGQLMGLPLKPLQGFGVPGESYGFANKQLAWETVAPLLDSASARPGKQPLLLYMRRSCHPDIEAPAETGGTGVVGLVGKPSASTLVPLSARLSNVASRDGTRRSANPPRNPTSEMFCQSTVDSGSNNAWIALPSTVWVISNRSNTPAVKPVSTRNEPMM